MSSSKILFLTLAIYLPLLSSSVAHGWGSPKPKLSYKNYKIEGFSVRVLSSIQSDPLVNPVLYRLQQKLSEAKRLSPRRLGGMGNRVVIWLTNSNKSNAAVYHPSAQWLRQNGQPPELEKGIEISNLKNFLDWNVTGDQPMMVVHELVHAYHDQVLSFTNYGVKNAYIKALASKKYERVRYRTPEGPLMKAYALNDEKEYFAEISEAYFGTNDYYPFTREDLRSFDPDGYQLMLTYW